MERKMTCGEGRACEACGSFPDEFGFWLAWTIRYAMRPYWATATGCSTANWSRWSLMRSISRKVSAVR
jgi:hypothetical protein